MSSEHYPPLGNGMMRRRRSETGLFLLRAELQECGFRCRSGGFGSPPTQVIVPHFILIRKFRREDRQHHFRVIENPVFGRFAGEFW